MREKDPPDPQRNTGAPPRRAPARPRTWRQWPDIAPIFTEPDDPDRDHDRNLLNAAIAARQAGVSRVSERSPPP